MYYAVFKQSKEFWVYTNEGYAKPNPDFKCEFVFFQPRLEYIPFFLKSYKDVDKWHWIIYEVDKVTPPLEIAEILENKIELHTCGWSGSFNGG